MLESGAEHKNHKHQEHRHGSACALHGTGIVKAVEQYRCDIVYGDTEKSVITTV